MPEQVLLMSQRRIADLVAYCLAYEFEDAISAVTDAIRVDVEDFRGIEFSRRTYKALRLVSGSVGLAEKVAPYPRNKLILDRDFELFFPLFNHVHELYALRAIPDWRKRCHKAACFITEASSDSLPQYLVEMLSEFDHIFLGFRNSVSHVARMTGRPCSYLPLAVDVLRFAPSTINQQRPIFVCNIGRRSDITHQALLQAAGRQQTFYYYDTVAASGPDRKHRTFRVDNPHEHRMMLATLLKHSQYFFANRSYVNMPEFTAQRDEISARFYEGAASGSIMIGEAPRSEEFKQQFDWPDAIIHVPFECPEIGSLLEDLGREPDRMLAARRKNVREAALRHDWLHRIQVVFKTLGLEPTDGMRARAQQLEQIASRA